MRPLQEAKKGGLPQIQVIYFLISGTDGQMLTKLFINNKAHAINLSCAPHDCNT